jgi:EAL domain-containing protein (putative c-di-GMP-specific phosphodiesterase class I)
LNVVETQGPEAEKLAAELGEAIEQRRLELYYQPVVSLIDRVASEVEALLRWPRNGGEILAPPDFIAIAKRFGLLLDLERWAIDAAFEQLSRWRRATDLDLSLNLSEGHVYSEALPRELQEAAERHGVATRRISLEIAEDSLIQAGGERMQKLQSLFAVGAGLIVDDFSAALPSDQLAALPTNALKISRRVVAGIPDNPDHTETVQTALRLSGELGVRVIANGVESPGQLAVLRDMGCEYGQGFLFSVPMPADVLAERAMPR